ncbi:hypothetical protein [Candidatus Magnetomonas plexicatena]|uniref:hypothetical protein n=1 Tax=Candidatus Magnetomonas plexicatena TaxID=2552947 RepID=UPI001105550F|nr:hypothetical protein E2O03_005545 [Nitrospirales bacterium LBB_01]
MTTTSKRLWLFAVILFLMLTSNAMFVFMKIGEIENQNRIINYAGMARGTIQRIVKLEMNEDDYQKHLTDVDWIITALSDKDSIHLSDNSKIEYDKGILKLSKSWNELKTLLVNHRNNMPNATEQDVVRKSEDCWNVANEVVFSIQHLFETRVKRVNSVVTFTVTNLIYSLVLLFFIRTFLKAQD